MESREASAAHSGLPHDGKTMLSLEEPAAGRPPVPRSDMTATVQSDYCVIDPRTTDNEDEVAVLGDEDEALGSDDDDDLYYTDDSDESSSNGDSDIEFEDDDEPLGLGDDGKAACSSDDVILAPVEFLGDPARFASVDSTAGFMLLRAGGAGAGQEDGGADEDSISVHYRYVRFLRDPSGGSGVEIYSGAKLHPVRFLLPSRDAAADPASSLRLIGAALADMVYPRRFSAQLRRLWCNLVAAAPVPVPPRAARVEATVSVGILRRRDRTPERMARVREALAVTAIEADAWPFIHNVGMVLQLPAPVWNEDDEGARPSKRRRLAVEAECAICFEVLERGLAAWPRCSHVFHGECLERLLVRGDQRCPLCRTELTSRAAS